ncbi:MAG: SOS response-associated peptidase [Eubacteriales bacterium]
MCGRYNFQKDIDDVEMQKICELLDKKFAGSPKLEKMKNGEVFPGDTAPVLISGSSGNVIPWLMEWGFPKWDNKGLIINSRAETVDEKPMFRELVKYNRCLIPATGYFEWEKKEDTKEKTKHLIKLESGKMLYMAGIYNRILDSAGIEKEVFTIITTEANEYVIPIHDRMPLIIEGESRKIWLGEGISALKLLKERCMAELETA